MHRHVRWDAEQPVEQRVHGSIVASLPDALPIGVARARVVAIEWRSMQDNTVQHERTIADETGLSVRAVRGVIALLEDGATVPFIARYRKEQTASTDEEGIRAVRDRIAELQELDRRRESMIESLRERELLSDALAEALSQATSKAEIEDIYLPYRQKRRTRAEKARERGLEPLAEFLLAGAGSAKANAGVRADSLHAASVPAAETDDLSEHAASWVNPQVDVPDVESALSGARDIIAEWVSEDAELRRTLRTLFERRAALTAKRARGVDAADEGAAVYRDYFDHSEAAAKAPAHRLLAMLRGEREGYLNIHVAPEDEQSLALIRRAWASSGSTRDRSWSRGDGGEGDAQERGTQNHGAHNRLNAACREQLDLALTDSYKRLLAPSLETERKGELESAAQTAAAEVFAKNLRELLLAAPMGGRRMLAVDPGMRTGCKIVCLDEHGELLSHEAIYPLPPRNQTREAEERVRALCDSYSLEVIAVGNGTGGREAHAFLRALGVAPVVTVNEAGASVYSASPLAKKEFPDHDVTVRGAVSIGRRLMDPLAELVKIDPQSIGVGQYQHDIDAKLLESRLSDTVVSCVNSVGADLNTASAHLLRHVAGLNAKSAEAVVEYRRARGGFRSRAELTKVSGLGPRRFEQAAGFLRVRGDHPLDATAVHPERYDLVERMAADLSVTLSQLVGNRALCERIDLSKYIQADVGLPTLEDIVSALAEPGRDPRPEWDPVEFREDVSEVGDLRTGMKLPGVVTNITDFGAFVDIGVHRDGLVHISRLADRFVKDPHEIVSVGAAVEVTVVEVDQKRGRISLSMVE